MYLQNSLHGSCLLTHEFLVNGRFRTPNGLSTCDTTNKIKNLFDFSKLSVVMYIFDFKASAFREFGRVHI